MGGVHPISYRSSHRSRNETFATRPLTIHFNVQPYLGVLATLVIGWILDALPGIRVGAVEMVGFMAASAFAVRVALKSDPDAPDRSH